MKHKVELMRIFVETKSTPLLMQVSLSHANQGIIRNSDGTTLCLDNPIQKESLDYIKANITSEDINILNAMLKKNNMVTYDNPQDKKILTDLSKLADYKNTFDESND